MLCSLLGSAFLRGTEVATATKVKPPPMRRSGFCNRSLPVSDAYNPHHHCTMPDCVCDCHQPFEVAEADRLAIFNEAQEATEMPKSGPPDTGGKYIHELVEEEREKIRYAVLWKNEQTAEFKVTSGWMTENDAALFLEVMIDAGMVDLSADMDVRSYVGEVPW